jgi:hypothetical protein
MFAVSMRVPFKVFLGKPQKQFFPVNLKNVFLFWARGLLVFLSLFFGFPNVLAKWLLELLWVSFMLSGALI